jgi:hypothetical protein
MRTLAAVVVLLVLGGDEGRTAVGLAGIVELFAKGYVARIAWTSRRRCWHPAVYE